MSNKSSVNRHNLFKSGNFEVLALALFSLFFLISCNSQNQDGETMVSNLQTDPNLIDMFGGKSLGQWEASDFFNPGKIYVKDGCIYIEKSTAGGYMQGVTWTGPLFKMNYEITLEAMRVEGEDFFCGLTFPVEESPCTLILGGWGGTLCGLSSLDYFDASENETTTFRDFNDNQWYKVRLRVTPNRIRAWLDEESLVDVDITDRIIDVRFECDPSRPLGIATYQTSSAIRNIKMRKLDELSKPDLNLEQY